MHRPKEPRHWHHFLKSAKINYEKYLSQYIVSPSPQLGTPKLACIKQGMVQTPETPLWRSYNSGNILCKFFVQQYKTAKLYIVEWSFLYIVTEYILSDFDLDWLQFGSLCLSKQSHPDSIRVYKKRFYNIQ